ncbi:hypothetical protein UFOVP820_41 [uncultured Caudovirales phage]|uniref:Uncharacterized protein n=1 Tax=uncultured Caudovirales phage TaxID=2100421 RepID=A0A6J5P8H4_9CAUD|nr:hypothetical protein UFOVP820_41 [uncultured Caudovirales phage]
MIDKPAGELVWELLARGDDLRQAEAQIVCLSSWADSISSSTKVESK